MKWGAVHECKWCGEMVQSCIPARSLQPRTMLAGTLRRHVCPRFPLPDPLDYMRCTCGTDILVRPDGCRLNHNGDPHICCNRS